MNVFFVRNIISCGIDVFINLDILIVSTFWLYLKAKYQCNIIARFLAFRNVKSKGCSRHISLEQWFFLNLFEVREHFWLYEKFVEHQN